jgi:hypothetical protein
MAGALQHSGHTPKTSLAKVPSYFSTTVNSTGWAVARLAGV